jgi:DEAD/DEAH box helicase domain-containing protein
VGRADLWLGPVEVRTRVVGYQRRETATGEVIENVPLDLPPSRLVTRAVWYVIPAAVVEAACVDVDELPGALHAAEHTAIGMLPLFTICDRWDVGGLSTPLLAETGAPTILVYDGYPGGSGIAELGFEAADRHLATTLEALRGCSCADGCPSCVQSPKCGNGNSPLSKAGAIRLLESILG